MNTIYVFLIQWDIPIYFICGVGLLVAFFQLGRARYTLRRAMFSLERERGQQIQSNALIFIGIFLVTLAVLFYVNFQIAPTLPETLLRPPPPTPNVFSTPLSSPTPLETTAAVTPRPRVTPNFAPTATLPNAILEAQNAEGETSDLAAATPSVNLNPNPAFIPEGGGCTPAVSISQPRPSEQVFGTIEFFGSANNPDFGFYLLEIRGTGTGGQWTSLLGTGIVDAVSNGPLGAINFSSLPNGPYDVRLTVLNSSGASVGECIIMLEVNNP